MDMDFSLVLLILVAVSGVIWLYDSLLLAAPRRQRFEEFKKLKGLSDHDFDNSDSKPLSKKLLEQVAEIQQEPVAVEYAKSFFPILLFVLVLRGFLFEPFQIPTGSMIPTLKVGDFILVNKFSYGVRLPVIGTKIMDVDDPRRGEIMVFIPPHDSSFFIKRVVGLPGDHVRYVNKTIYINGEPMDQELVEFRRDDNPPVIHIQEQLGVVNHDVYIDPSPAFDFAREGYWLKPEGMIVPEGHYFMMGDNRDNSDDSRRWGPVPEENIVGKAFAIWMHKEPGLHLPTFSNNRFLNTEP